jgi:hypothetical protein
MNDELKHQLAIIEEKEIRNEMSKTLKQQENHFRKINHNYMKENDINDFRNYKAMLTDKFLLKKAKNQNEISARTGCRRKICN